MRSTAVRIPTLPATTGTVPAPGQAGRCSRRPQGKWAVGKEGEESRATVPPLGPPLRKQIPRAGTFASTSCSAESSMPILQLRKQRCGRDSVGSTALGGGAAGLSLAALALSSATACALQAHLWVQAPSSLPLPGPVQPVEASRRARSLCCLRSERRTVQTGGVESAREPMPPGCPGDPDGGGRNTHEPLQAAIRKPQPGPLHNLPWQPSPGGHMRAHLRPPRTHMCIHTHTPIRTHVHAPASPRWGEDSGPSWRLRALPISGMPLTSQFPDGGLLILHPFESRPPPPLSTSLALAPYTPW